MSEDSTVQWIDLSDFTPGIYGDVHAGLGNTARGALVKNGAATIADTYRCVADQFGALVPLPKRVQGKTQTLIPGGNGNASTSFYPANQIGCYLQDAYVSNQFAVGGGTTSSTPYSIYTLWNFNYQPAGTGTPFYNLWLGRNYRQFTSPATTKDFFWESSNPTTQPTATAVLFPGNLAEFKSSIVAPVYWIDYGTGVAILANGYFNHAAAGIVAGELPLTTYDTDVGVNYPAGAAAAGFLGLGWPSLLAYHPNPASLASFGTYSTVRDTSPVAPNWYGSIGGTLMIGHQGRIVTVMGNYDARGAGGDSAIDDRLHYTTALNLNVATDSFVANLNPENTSGITVIASANTDELFCVNNKGGGFTVRGDMSNPTVTILRSIESTFGVRQTPAYTPIGIVYCTPNGVFVYQGGETTPKLSTQLESSFWDYSINAATPETNFMPRKGRLGYFHPWVCVPNNFLYDTNLKSWWRLEDPTTNSSIPYSIYDVDSQFGKLFAFPYKLTGSQNTVWDEYDPDVQASSFSWRSQPLLESVERLQSYQEIELTASSGKGTSASTVTVTLTGIDPNGAVVSSPATAFTFTGTGTTNAAPYVKRKKIVTAFVAKHVQVLITSVNSASDPAPKIHGIKISHRDGNLPARG